MIKVLRNCLFAIPRRDGQLHGNVHQYVVHHRFSSPELMNNYRFASSCFLIFCFEQWTPFFG